MDSISDLKNKLEIDFLKSKTYEEINVMFNQLNDKLNSALAENERLSKLLEQAKSEGRAEATTKIIRLFHDFEYNAKLTPNDVIKLISENA